MGEKPRPPIYDNEGRVTDPNIAHEMAKIEDPYHEKRFFGAMKASDKKIREGERAAAEAGPEIQKQVEFDKVASLFKKDNSANFNDFLVRRDGSMLVAAIREIAYTRGELLSQDAKSIKFRFEGGPAWDGSQNKIRVEKLVNSLQQGLDAFVKEKEQLDIRADEFPTASDVPTLVETFKDYLEEINANLE